MTAFIILKLQYTGILAFAAAAAVIPFKHLAHENVMNVHVCETN